MLDTCFELFRELSAAEQEVEIARAANRYRHWLDCLPAAQRWQVRRRAELKVAKSYRAAYREVGIHPFFAGLKRSQARMRRLRIERAMG